MANFILIKSTDDTDVLVNLERIECIQKKKGGCIIKLTTVQITSGADFDEVVNALNKNANSETEDAPEVDIAEVINTSYRELSCKDCEYYDLDEDSEDYYICEHCFRYGYTDNFKPKTEGD